MSATLRTLFRHSENPRSNTRALLAQVSQLGGFWVDSTRPFGLELPRDGAFPPLVCFYSDGDDWRLKPNLMAPTIRLRKSGFESWWRGPIHAHKVHGPLSREKVVLSVADKLGGTHVDQKIGLELDEFLSGEYFNIRVNERLVRGFAPSVVRVIAHETLLTLRSRVPALFREPYRWIDVDGSEYSL